MSILAGGGSSLSTGIRCCILCCHSMDLHTECKRVRALFEGHQYIGINKMSRYIRLPSEGSNKLWRSVIFEGVHPSTKDRLREGSDIRIAAHHFLSDCIGESETKILKKFFPMTRIYSRYNVMKSMMLKKTNI